MTWLILYEPVGIKSGIAIVNSGLDFVNMILDSFFRSVVPARGGLSPGRHSTIPGPRHRSQSPVSRHSEVVNFACLTLL